MGESTKTFCLYVLDLRWQVGSSARCRKKGIGGVKLWTRTGAWCLNGWHSVSFSFSGGDVVRTYLVIRLWGRAGNTCLGLSLHTLVKDTHACR